MSYSTAVGRFMERDPMGYPDGLNSYEFEQSNPTNKLDPLGLYVIDFGGNFSEDQKMRVVHSLDRIKSRADALVAQILAAKNGMTPCVKNEMAGELDELQKRMSDISTSIQSSTDYWILHQEPLDNAGQIQRGTNASTNPQTWATNRNTTLNTSSTGRRTPWTGWSDEEVDRKLLHEIAHLNEPGGDQDGTGHLYDPHLLEGLMNQDLTHSVTYRYLLLQAQKKCKCATTGPTK